MPKNGDRLTASPTGVMPRKKAWIHAYPEYGTHLQPWERQRGARSYDCMTRENPRALIRSAQGLSYSSAYASTESARRVVLEAVGYAAGDPLPRPWAGRAPRRENYSI